ncbi:MAG: hypothetical protein JRI23_09465, partial [Deltaproteobacteria bacterium]|nr:hypothetical protein [Deltaproteobacteria bacterium]MBW2531877.1 hypothetical protein [Deltaproteobacteria bacterium]
MSGESPGTLIGPYEVILPLEGQASEVYLARRHGQERGPQFILILFEVREVDARIIQADAERCRQIDHRAITRLVEMFEHGNKRVLAFDSVPGTSLHRLMIHLRKEGEKLADGAAFHIGKYLFGALAKAHTFEDEDGRSAPIVHGQLGPHQVILSWTGAITIMGFGMSRLFRLAESILAEPEELKPFMAPEQRAGYAPTARANVYSAAAMLWSLLANELPPTDDAKPQSLLERRQDLPEELSKAIDQALEPAITQRTITAGEIEKIFDGLATSDDRRQLKWNMEVFKEMKPAELGFIPPESLPPSLLSDVPSDEDDQSVSFVPDSGSDVEPTATYKIPKGIGVYSMIGSDSAAGDGTSTAEHGAEPLPKKKLGRAQSIGVVKTAGRRRERQMTLRGTGTAVLSRDEEEADERGDAKPGGQGAAPAAAARTAATDESSGPRRKPPRATDEDTKGPAAKPLPFKAKPQGFIAAAKRQTEQGPPKDGQSPAAPPAGSVPPPA